MTFSSYCTKRR